LRKSKKIFFISAFILILVTVLVLSSGKFKSTIQPDQKPNVLILSMETFRWDRLGAAGYHRPLTPEIDRFAAAGTLFMRNYSQGSWTRPSIASTFTSFYPAVHRMGRVDSNEIFKELENSVVGERVVEAAHLDKKFITMAEAFKARGYRCFGWAGNPQIWGGMGFKQGFDVYNAMDMEDPEIVKQLEELFNDQSETPFFTFVHFMTPHSPYDPPEKYRIYDSNPEALNLTHKVLWPIRRGEIKLSQKDIQHNKDLYDGDIMYMDNLIGQVLSAARQTGIIDNTLIIITSDHGEEFMEHGNIGHGFSLYEELIHVPLIFSGHRMPKGKKIEALTQNIDLFPTLISLVFDEKLAGLQGKNIMPLIRGNTPLKSRHVFADRGALHAIVGQKWKYILNSDTGEKKLYSLIDDPEEMNNLAGNNQYAPILTELDEKLRRMMNSNIKRSKHYKYKRPAEVPEKLVQRLRALGYIK